MHRLIHLCLAFSMAIGCGSSGSTVFAEVTDAAAPISYRLFLSRLGLSSAIDVEVTIRSPDRGPLPEPLELAIPNRWAGAADLSLDVVDLQADGLDGESLELHRNLSTAAIHHDGREALVLRYRIDPRARDHTRGSRFHAVGAAEYFFAFGRNVFVWPVAIPTSTPVILTMVAEQRNAFWATTLGVFRGRGQLSEVQIGDLLDAVFMAGRPRVIETTREGRAFAVAVDPGLGSIEDDALEMVQQLVLYTARVLGDPPERATVALLLRRVDDPNAMVGTGRRGGFVLELGDAVGPGSAGLAELIAHENLHRYIGNWVRFVPATELDTLWFKEGMVDYLASLSALNVGQIDRERFLETLAGAATGYLTNDYAGTAVDSDAEYWRDESLRLLPYDQGFLVAFWLDVQLRRIGDRLETAVSAIVSQNTGGTRLDNEALQQFFEDRLDRNLTELFEVYIQGGELLPVEGWLEGAGLTLERIWAEPPIFCVSESGSGDFRGLMGLGHLE